jgi:hypothetical protein
MPRGSRVSAPSPSPVSGSSRRCIDRCPPPSVARCYRVCQTPPPPSLFHLSRTKSGPSTSPLWHPFKTCRSLLGKFFSPRSFSSCPQHCPSPPLPLIHTDIRTHRRGHRRRHYRLRGELHPPRRSIHFFHCASLPLVVLVLQDIASTVANHLDSPEPLLLWKRRRDAAPSRRLSSVTPLQ